MPKIDPKALAHLATDYLKKHPEEILRVLRGAIGLRFGLPMDAVRYFARELGGGPKAPKDVVIEAAPPGIRFGATVDAMGTPLRALAVVYVEELDIRHHRAPHRDPHRGADAHRPRRRGVTDRRAPRIRRSRSLQAGRTWWRFLTGAPAALWSTPRTTGSPST